MSVPVLITLTYQLFSKWKLYLLANLATSFIMGFIGVSLFSYICYYEIDHEYWGLFSSFLVLFIVTLVVKVLIDLLKDK